MAGMKSALFTSDWRTGVRWGRVDRPQIGGIAPFLASGASVMTGICWKHIL